MPRASTELGAFAASTVVPSPWGSRYFATRLMST